MTLLATFALFAIVALVVGLLRHRKKMAATFNAIQAEMTLGQIELVKENPFCRQLRDEILNIVRVATGGAASEDSGIKKFNSTNRFTQLNVVANALWNLGHGPNLENRVDPWGWYKVGNPLMVLSADQRLIQQVCDLAKKEQRANVQIPTKPLQIIGEYIFDMERFRITDHPQAQAIPDGVVEGVHMLVDTAQMAAGAIKGRQFQLGLSTIAASMATPVYAKSSPSTKRDILQLREQLRYMLALERKALRGFEPAQDVVEALIQRRETTHGVNVDKSDNQYWIASPEFSILSTIGQAAETRPVSVQAVDMRTIEASVRALYSETTIPFEHIAYVVKYAKGIFFMT